MAEVWGGVQDLGGRLGRRGAVRLLAGGAVLVAGSTVLSACGPSVPGAVATNGGASVSVASAVETNAKTMVSNQNGAISLVARGTSVGTATTDNSTYYFATEKKDGTWSCQVKAQGGTAPNALAGIMARNDGTPGAAFAGVFITPTTNGVVFRWRTADAQAGQAWPMAIAIGVTAPIWLQLQKAGDNFTCAYSQDGKTWNNQTSVQVSFTNPSWLVGLAACAANPTMQVDQFTNCVGFKPNAYLDINPANLTSSSTKG